MSLVRLLLIAMLGEQMTLAQVISINNDFLARFAVLNGVSGSHLPSDGSEQNLVLSMGASTILILLFFEMRTTTWELVDSQ